MRPVPVLLAALALVGALPPAPCATAAPRKDGPWRVAVVTSLSGPHAAAGEEVLLGARTCAEFRSGRGGVGGRPVEVVAVDDRDDPAAVEKTLAAALAGKPDALVAAPTARTVDALATKLRGAKGRVPTVFVGAAAPVPALDPRDVVRTIGGGAVDQAIFLANTLVLPCRSKRPALLVEEGPRAQELEAALVRNLGRDRAFVGVRRVAPGSPVPAEALAPWREAGADRLVVAGGPGLLDATVAARAALGWDVALLVAEGGLTAASAAVRERRVAPAHFAAATPQRTLDGAPRPLYDAVEKTTPPGAPVVVLPRTVDAWTAVDVLVEAAASVADRPRKDADLLTALGEVRYGPDESHMPFFDLLGRASLLRRTLWTADAAGLAPTEPGFLPRDDFGPLLGLRPASSYKAEPGTKVVWVTWGDATSKPPRTIDRDLADLGLATRGYEGSLDAFVLDEVLARAIGKMHRLFLRNEDGTAIPGVSFAISFTTERPVDRKPDETWTMVCAGDDAEAGGRAFPGEARCEVYATFLRRTIFQGGAITPRLDHDDLAFVNGTHPWKGVKLEHLRADQVRGLVDGYAGAFALTGAHELGHLAGLGHDEEDPRSIMNVTEGVGLRENQAFFIGEHARVLERTLGRTPLPRR
ncbi:MAG: ABC transporter substrate-binding protein [Planctomycetes bacterium]|nr:ABC transporter substrate-binding protein [Planctomycetota bacterium]